jgi:hypothetical protein
MLGSLTGNDDAIHAISMCACAGADEVGRGNPYLRLELVATRRLYRSLFDTCGIGDQLIAGVVRSDSLSERTAHMGLLTCTIVPACGDTQS